MITERHEELAALRALGLLEGAELNAFERESSGHPELGSLVDALGDATSALAFTVPQHAAPPGLRERILAHCRQQDPRPVPGAATSMIVPFRRYLPWATAAMLALTAAWLASQNLALRTTNEALQTRQQLAEIAWHAAENQLAERSLLAETMISDLGRRLRRSEDLARLKVSALASLAGNTAEARAIAVWDPDQQTGLLTFEKLPAIKDNQDYQIWVVDPAYPNPVNGGVFHVESDGTTALAFKPDQPVTRAAAFAISLERKGGVPKAEGPIVLLGKLPEI